MNQKLSLSLFFSGLATFLTSLGEFFSQHQTWHDMTTPNEVGHLTIMIASFIITVVGALGTQLPRNGSYTDRVSDTKLNELKGDK